ncbi:MAG: glycosyltransferase, partial [Planctomycetales bacterium]|nr:glycosyltransferase [Planctomycetales bacterium]
AEVLLVNLIRGLDRKLFAPELCCLKELGPLGEQLADEVPAHSQLIGCRWDVSVLWRLTRLMRSRKVDAVVTVGAGDKMFWGRLAAWLAGVPVVCSALHSTGWPDGVGRLNRLLTPLTDAFIGVAQPHGRFLVEFERFPAAKVRVIPNGVDTNRFQPRPEAAAQLRHELGIPADAPVAGLVAALRPEKNHELFLETAALVSRRIPAAHFVLAGDGPQRQIIEAAIDRLKLRDRVHLLGTRSDVPEVLSTCDVFLLTSDNEASPVSILEAMAVGLPVVATQVGSVPESVVQGETGFLAPPGDAAALAAGVEPLLADAALRGRFGAAGRRHVEATGSLSAMVRGYEQLLLELHGRKRNAPATTARTADNTACSV